MSKMWIKIILSLSILIVGLVIVWQRGNPGQIIDHKNISYEIEGRNFQLINGVSETKITLNGKSKTVTRYFGNEAVGDLNGDGVEDIAFLLTEDGGGSGTFFYIAVALKTNSGWKGTNAIFLGDRIAPQNTNIIDNRVIVNYADRNPGEPMVAKPSVGVSKYFIIQNGVLEEKKG